MRCGAWAPDQHCESLLQAGRLRAGLLDDSLRQPAHIASHTMLFKVDYINLNPSELVIGRGLYIEADSLEQAQRLAQEKCRCDERIECVRRFARGEVA